MKHLYSWPVPRVSYESLSSRGTVWGVLLISSVHAQCFLYHELFHIISRIIRHFFSVALFFLPWFNTNTIHKTDAAHLNPKKYHSLMYTVWAIPQKISFNPPSKSFCTLRLNTLLFFCFSFSWNDIMPLAFYKAYLSDWIYFATFYCILCAIQ